MQTVSKVIQEGKSLAEQYRLAEAIEHFKRLLASPAEEEAARIWLARLALMKDDFAGATVQLEALLKRQPRSAEALALEGILHIKRGEFKTAVEWLEAARAIEPTLAMIYPNLALSYRELKAFSKSLEAARSGAELGAENQQARREVARTLWEMGQRQEAIETALNLLESDPRSFFAYLDLGGWLMFQRRVGAAIALYQEGLRHIPAAWSFREQLSSLYLATGQATEAVTQARSLAEQRGLVEDHILLGQCLKAVSDLVGAERAFEAAVQSGPRRWEGHYELAELYGARGAGGEAEREYGEAVAKSNGSFEPANGLGLFLLDQRRTQEAQAVLEEALRLAPDRVEPKLNLALCLARLNKLSRAKTLTREVLSAAPSDSDLDRQAQQLLEAIGRVSGERPYGGQKGRATIQARRAAQIIIPLTD